MLELSKRNWKEDHLARLHNENYDWCPLCVARAEGEDNPPQHLVPPQQDPSQTGMKYLQEGYDPKIEYKHVIEDSDEKVVGKETSYDAEFEKTKRAGKKLVKK